MKLITIPLRSCGVCPHNTDSFVPAPNSSGTLGSCRHPNSRNRLIQTADEAHGPFPAWCPLPDSEITE